MITLRWALLVRGVPLVLGLLCACPMPAQEQRGSLTDEFQGLSAKERSRIAEREVKEAAVDPAFQAVMAEAEAHFQAGRYPEALDTYRKARGMRPYNVYPKVKIQDLEALIADSAPAKAATGTAEAAAPVVPQPPSAEPVRSANPPDAERVPLPAAEKRAGAEVATPATVRSAPEAVPAWKGEGGEERRYKEGQAYVIERTVLDDGRPVVYKRVQHPWGQVFHFRNGEAVDERIWRERFGEP